MHTFYKVLQKNTLRKKICVFLCALCTASLVVLSNANAVGYTCSNLTYVECNKDYYLSDCSAPYNVDEISSPSSGNSCKPCSTAGDNYECAGGTKCPVITTKDVTCTAGKYIAKGAKTCSDCPPGYFCEGGTYTIAADGATEAVGATACAKGSYSAAGASACIACAGGKTTSGTGKSSCDADCENNLKATSWATATWTKNSVSNGCKISACDAGYALNSYTQMSQYSSGSCSACATGHFKSTASAEACTPCDKGTYQNTTGQTSCNPCGKGTYQDAEGQISCKACTKIDNSEWEDSSGLTSNTCPFKCTGNYIKVGRECQSCNPEEKCPDGYDGKYDKCKSQTPEGICKAYCKAGEYVAAAGAACSPVPSDAYGYAAAPHTVAYGATSPTLSPCPGGATGNDEGASAVTDCYTDCAAKTINNGTASVSGGHRYYTDGGYTNTQNCKYSVDCDPRYGAQNADGENTHNTNSPMCTLCEDGYYSAGNVGEQCKPCSGMPTDGVAKYTTNATTETGCLWHCNKGRYRHTTTVVASGGGGTKTTYSCNLCKTNTSIPVTSSWDPVDPKDLSKGYKNDKITGCYISSITENGEATKVTDSTGTFKYRMYEGGNFNPCYHK